MPFDTAYELASYPAFGSGGLNLFSTPDNVKDNQALDLVNFLFEGAHLRPRKGVTDLSSTSLGNYGITGTHQFRKASGFSQILATYAGQLFLYDESDSSFSAVDLFVADTVSATNDDSLITATNGHFTLLGYGDSIAVYINNILYYVYQILTDDSLYLYTTFDEETDGTAEMVQATELPVNTPTLFDTWMDRCFIVGTSRLLEWDGDEISVEMGDTTTYAIVTADTGDCAPRKGRLMITVTPTFTAQGYEYNDLAGHYITSYNDTSTATRCINTPLEISQQWGDSCYVIVDTIIYSRHFGDSAQQFRIIPPFNDEKLIYAGTVDSIASATFCAQTTGGRVLIICDSSQTWDSTDLSFGAYMLKEVDTTGSQVVPPGEESGASRRAVLRLVNDANDTTNLHSFYYGSNIGISAGDSFEVYRLQSSILEEVPKYITHWQDRQWRAGYAEDPNLLLYSDLFDPDSFPATYYIYIDRDDGDVITAFVVLSFQDYLLVFKNKSIYAITTSGFSPWDWTVTDVVEGIGTPAWASVVSYGRNVYFYDYEGFYVMSGIEPQKISWAIEPIVQDSINRNYAHLIVGGYFDSHLWWSYPSGTSTRNNRTVLYNLENQAWTKTDLNLASIFVGLDEDDEHGVLLGCADSGKVWAYGGGWTDNDVGITTTCLSGWLDMRDDYETVKEFKDFQFLLDKADSSLLYIDMYKDYSTTAFTSDTVGVDDSDILVYHKRTIEDYNLGQRLQVKLRATRCDQDFRLPFFKVKWKPVGEIDYD